jgi:hypothetical protein
MRRPARILLAGTLIVILPCGAATSQTAPSSYVDAQVQLGDVFSQQTLNVEDVSDSTTGVSTATANALSRGVEGGDLDMHSNQNANGAVGAGSNLNVGSYSGESTSLTTAATGNTGDATVVGGTLTGVYTQDTAATSINAYSQIEASGASAGDVTANTQAIGNSQGLGVSYGVAGARISQTNDASIDAEGSVSQGYVGGSGVYTSGAVGNNVTLNGDGGSGERVIATQQNNGGVQAVQNTAIGNGYITSTSATAAGNNINAVNEGFLLDATTNQQNNEFVSAHANAAADLFGAGAAIANGVGNSVVAGDIGGEVLLDNTQENNAGIEAVASFSGNEGYDGSASATATGNAITGYACADCNGRMTVGNTQTNNVDVSASSTVNVGSARSAFGVATAVGNTASYYVTRPSGQ